MKISDVLPFKIQKLPISLEKEKVKDDSSSSGPETSDSNNYGYYVSSTGQIHVEDDPVTFTSDTLPTGEVCPKEQNWNNHLNEIAQRCYECKNLVIAIHGYSVPETDAKTWYNQIYAFITGKQSLENDRAEEREKFNPAVGVNATVGGSIRDSVFIGYRWPAEPRDFSKQSIEEAFGALPTLLIGILLSSYVLGTITYSLLVGSVVLFLVLSVLTIGSVILLLRASRAFNFGFTAISGALLCALGAGLYYWQAPLWLLGLLTAGTVFLGAMIVTLIVLRLVTYARDRYRASNYGTTDLVELIRQIDKHTPTKSNDIEISFIAHSLGCEVLTQAVRILSDVFDPLAVAQEGRNCKLGDSFKFSRLVLVAPDIPIESILSGRANFLKSSLRRFQEAYVFCNEADLALRIASTAANYISFPARNRFRGYKLGNITVQHFENKTKRRGWTIEDVENHPPGLEIRASNLEHRNLVELGTPHLQDAVVNADERERHALLEVANAFTYFDCTDYKDIQVNYETGERSTVASGVVSHVEKQSALNFYHYVKLIFWSGRSKNSAAIDFHSGYFKGEWTQNLIYGMAFLGEQAFLSSSGLEDLPGLERYCRWKQIQVVLAGEQS